MIKLITPPGMLFTTALLVIYGTYAAMIGSIEQSFLLLVGTAVAAVATYGTAMVRPWSRYLVYALTAGFFAKFGISMFEAHQAGFFAIQFGSKWEIAASLAPSCVMAGLGVICCTIVYRQFPAATAAQAKSPAQDVRTAHPDEN
jgi:hypothetical protein